MCATPDAMSAPKVEDDDEALPMQKLTAQLWRADPRVPNSIS
jgi:hypothetical protein